MLWKKPLVCDGVVSKINIITEILSEVLRYRRTGADMIVQALREHVTMLHCYLGEFATHLNRSCHNLCGMMSSVSICLERVKE